MNVVQEKFSLRQESSAFEKTGTLTLAALVRPMRPEEAAAVSHCVYHCYGYSYPNKNMYNPVCIQELNRDGKIASYVAVDRNNKLIGHAALELDNGNPTVAEMGNALVYPEYRSGGLLNTFAQVLVNAAKSRRLSGVFVGSVCSHPYSQKAAHKLGFSDTALFLSRLPHMNFRYLSSAGCRRENILYSFCFFQLDKEVALYPPKHHYQMVEQIYRGLGKRVSLQLVPEELSVGKTAFHVVADSYGAVHVFFSHNNDVTVEAAGKPNFFRYGEQTETVYLYLDLAAPETPLLCTEYEKQGYFFAGVLPGAKGYNWLVLQYLTGSCINYTKLQVASELGRDLVDYIRRHDPR